MILALTSLKGGVGKTTTAVHLAHYLNREGPTLLVDADPNRSALAYSEHGSGLGFKVATERQAPLLLQRGTFDNVILDTRGRPTREDLQEIAEGCDHLVVPTPPEALAIRALMELAEFLEPMKVRWRVVLTMVLSYPVRDGEEARKALEKAGIPLFSAEIPRSVLFSRAAGQGVVVSKLEGAPRGRLELLSGSYEALWRELSEVSS
jgi:chromosome partitioning protein